MKERVSFKTKNGQRVSFLKKKTGSVNKLPKALKRWALATKEYHKKHPGLHSAIIKRGTPRYREISRLAKSMK